MEYDKETKTLSNTKVYLEEKVESIEINSINSNLPFISMKQENLNLFKDSIKRIGDDIVLLFDIDNTLYKSTKEFKKNQDDSYNGAYYKLSEIHSNKNIPPLSESLKKYNLFTEMFRNVFNVSPIEIELIRTKCDYSDFLTKNDKLIDFISSLPFRKWCFTNSVKSRAFAILEVTGFLKCFEGVIGHDDEDLEVFGKPKNNAYEFVEKLLGIENKKKVVFFDDNVDNIKTGKEFGWTSVHVSNENNLIDLINDALKSN